MVCPGEFHKPSRNLRTVSSSSIALPARAGLRFPIEIRADIGAAPAAGLANKSRLEIGQADFIRPWVSADRDEMAASVIGAVDQETANASGAHFSQGDLLLGDRSESQKFR
jgi:hypothetical protein